LLLLPFPIALADLPFAPIEDFSGETVAAFPFVELDEDTSPVCFVVYVGEEEE